MVSWISKNFRTFLWALMLSIAVWVAAVTSADPDETRALSSPVQIQVLGQDPGLVVSSDLPKEVEVTLRAPHSVWEVIDADPRTVKAILDLSGLSAGEHLAELQIQVGVRPVKIVSASPRTLSFSLEELSTESLPIKLTLHGAPSIGYQVGDPVLEIAEVAVSGALSHVKTVAQVNVSLNINGARENMDQILPIAVLDGNGLPVQGVTVSPDKVRVTLPVSQQGGYRDVAIKVDVVGRVAGGYRLTDISVFPPVVTVFAANPDLVNALPGVVETLPIDLQNAREDVSTRIPLKLPEGISIVGDQTVLVQAGVSPIESSITLAGEKVEIINLAAGLDAQVMPGTVDVIVSGPLPLLDTLTRQDVRVTVDLNDLKPGVYQLKADIQVLISDVRVDSILPGTIQVIITPAGVQTATPAP